MVVQWVSWVLTTVDKMDIQKVVRWARGSVYWKAARKVVCLAKRMVVHSDVWMAAQMVVWKDSPTVAH
jgi:hypothetical protein